MPGTLVDQKSMMVFGSVTVLMVCHLNIQHGSRHCDLSQRYLAATQTQTCASFSAQGESALIIIFRAAAHPDRLSFRKRALRGVFWVHMGLRILLWIRHNTSYSATFQARGRPEQTASMPPRTAVSTGRATAHHSSPEQSQLVPSASQLQFITRKLDPSAGRLARAVACGPLLHAVHKLFSP